jgi:peptidoglycan/LPS O-acetylase OafA/YrhL
MAKASSRIQTVSNWAYGCPPRSRRGNLAEIVESMHSNHETVRLRGMPASFTPFVPALTGIRAVAALIVLALHAQQLSTSGLIAHLPFPGRGYLGVDRFFLLSGFIITHVYLASLVRPDGNAVAIFFWHRIVRLWPVHVTVLAALLPISYLAGGMGFNSPQGEPAICSGSWGVMNTLPWNPPAWSNSAEWFAYLLFPLLALGLRRLRSAAASILLAILVLAATAAVFAVACWTFTGDDVIGAPALTSVAGEFVCGALLRRALDGRMISPSRACIGDAAGAVAFALFLAGASTPAPDFLLVLLLAVVIMGRRPREAFSRPFSAVVRWSGSGKFPTRSTWCIFRSWCS